jgi:hypothetical protein
MLISTEVWCGCCILPLKSVFNSFRENDITDALDLTFSTEDDRFGEVVTVDLKPGGQDIPVTNENKKDYVEYIPSFILISVSLQVGVFRNESRNNSRISHRDSMNLSHRI